MAGRLLVIAAGLHLVPIARHDEQRVVNADGQAEHRGKDRCRRAEVDEAGEGGDAGDADPDADQCGQQRHTGHQQRAEGDDQDDDGHADAEQLGRPGLGHLLECIAADRDLEPGVAGLLG